MKLLSFVYNNVGTIRVDGTMRFLSFDLGNNFQISNGRPRECSEILALHVDAEFTSAQRDSFWQDLILYV